MYRIKDFFRRETVFSISFLLAVVSAFLIHPDRVYLSYPDYRTLSLLFCLMIIVAGFQDLGVFASLGHILLKRVKTSVSLSLALGFLCFFCSMVITNDVTLITFVPFTIMVCRMTGQEKNALKWVVLETIAANLGSMATPIGNPQNLYLYSAFEMTSGQFVKAVLPYAALALILLAAVLLTGKKEKLTAETVKEKADGYRGNFAVKLAVFAALLILCLLVVFRVLPYLPVLLCVILATWAADRKMFGRVDYFLLFTFICFFVFIGNVKRLPEVSALLASLVGGRELWAGVLASQVISNVPAAILLSGFSEDIPALLTGVNLGGLGTLIASLASLISFKLFAVQYPDERGRFMKVFTVWNLVFLGLLAAAAAFLVG